MKSFIISQKITSRSVDSFNQYLKEIATFKTLNKDEELECAKRAKDGDKRAFEELIKANLRFVVSVAKQYANDDNPLEDLVNEGNIGLIMAAERFEPESGFKFISFAVFWIRKMIIEHISNKGTIIRIPANKINNISKLDKQISELEQKNGRSVTIDEVIEEMEKNGENIDDKAVSDYRQLDYINSYQFSSMDRPVNDDGDSTTCFSDLIENDNYNLNSDNDVLSKDKTRILNGALSKLKERDKKVLIMLFGLDDSEPKTLSEVGDELGLSREMIRNIRDKNITKLKSYLNHYKFELI
jgi:RNA polymerase primary sigma factor